MIINSSSNNNYPIPPVRVAIADDGIGAPAGGNPISIFGLNPSAPAV